MCYNVNTGSGFSTANIDLGELIIYKRESGVRLNPLSHDKILATQLTNPIFKAFAYIAAFFGFGVVSSVLVKGGYKTFWCDKSISETWNTSTSAKLETCFCRVIYEEIQKK